MKKEVIVVTGGAGFIGSNIVKELNAQGYVNIVIIDSLTKAEKWRNLVDLKFIDFVNYSEGIKSISDNLQKYKITGIYHIGANADVSVEDGNCMLDLNFIHSKWYFDYARENGIPFIYASSSAVYGNSNNFSVGSNSEKPHNVYALSKWMFDNYVRSNLDACHNKVIGFRFFNVFGLGEFHKGKNASLPFRFFDFIKTKGFIDLFEGADKIVRDYILVDDLAQTLIYAMENDVESGIYNLGSGMPLSHLEIAEIVVNELIEHNVINGEIKEYITYISMPDTLKQKFQFYTCAQDLPAWMEHIKFRSIKEKMKDYITALTYKERG